MKKPSASVSLYHQFALKHHLARVENAPPLDEKANWQEKERWEKDRDTIFRLAKLYRNAGFAWWVPVLVALALCLLFILWLASQVGRSESYLYPYHYWRVVQNLSPCQSDGSCGNLYMIQEVNDGVANPPTIVDFRDPQHFEAGQTFSHMQGRWIGSAFAVERWDLVRQDRPAVFINGKFRKLPTLAPNCDFDWSTPEGHVVCKGGVAKFD